MRLRPFFSYFGAKWRASTRYPSPVFPRLIEPFAGSACYSLLHHQKNVTLIDSDPVISNLWKWLITVDESEIMRIPINIEDVSDLDLCDEAKHLVGFWFVKGAARPATKRYAWARSGQWNNQFWGNEIRERICFQLKFIRHWKVISGSYECAEDVEATWFIDPPYMEKGSSYKMNTIDYDYLSKWCKSRRGQFIVCEQKGADWLPFTDFYDVKSLKSRLSSEVVFIGGDQGRIV